MEIRKVQTAQIKPDLDNPREDLEAGDIDLEKLRGSIREFGCVEPLVWNEATGHIVGGHQRFKILLAEGATEIEVVVVHLSIEKEKALNLALNKIRGRWDERKLAQILDGLVKVPDFDVKLTGFDSPEVADLLASLVPKGPEDKEENFDLAEELARAPEAVTKPGDRIQLGRHVLMCGDSADPEQVNRLLDGNRIHLVNQDPPYNVKVEPRSNNAIAAARQDRKHHQGLDLARHPSKAKATGKLRAKDRPLANDFVSTQSFDKLLRAWFGNAAQALLPGRGFYIWGGYANLANYPAALEEAGLYFAQAIIWVKGHPVMTRKDFMGNHEWCLYGWKNDGPHYFTPGLRNVTDVWTVKKVSPQSMCHLTEKPVELAVRAMTYSSRPGENVLDLFGGSGSTLIGAERVGRRAFLMELDCLYADVIVRRFLNFVGPKTAPELAERYGVTEGGVA